MTASAPSKLASLSTLAASIPDGASVALGGSFLHRGPFALARDAMHCANSILTARSQSKPRSWRHETHGSFLQQNCNARKITPVPRQLI